jgi:chromosome segregation ATPase
MDSYISKSDREASLMATERAYFKLREARDILEDKLAACQLASTELAKEILEVTHTKHRYEALLKKAESLIIERDKEIKSLRALLGHQVSPEEPLGSMG